MAELMKRIEQDYQGVKTEVQTQGDTKIYLFIYIWKPKQVKPLYKNFEELKPTIIPEEDWKQNKYWKIILDL